MLLGVNSRDVAVEIVHAKLREDARAAGDRTMELFRPEELVNCILVPIEPFLVAKADDIVLAALDPALEGLCVALGMGPALGVSMKVSTVGLRKLPEALLGSIAFTALGLRASPRGSILACRRLRCCCC